MLIPLRWNDIQSQFHSSRTGHDLVLKPRQTGISTYIQAEMFRREVTRTARSITLSHLDSATTFLRDMSDRFWKYCKFGNIQPRRERNSAVLTTYPDFDSSHTIGTAGSLDIGRGGSFSQFHGSEVAFWADAEAIMQGAMQGGNPDVILESTPNGAQGYFYEMCMDALAGRGMWKLHFYPWFKHSEYAIYDDIVLTWFDDDEQELIAKFNLSTAQIKWRRMKKAELKSAFFQEYPEDAVTCFLTSGRGYFGDLSGNFGSVLGATYDPTHRYTGGLDFGQTNDFTYMPVIDRTTRQMVDYLRVNQQSWADQRQEIKKMYNKWHLSGLRAEKNSIGSPNIEALQADGVEVEPFDTSNESKRLIFSQFHEELETGLQLLDEPVMKAEMMNLISTQLPSGKWKIAARGEGHDDCPIGLALAVTAKMHTQQPRIIVRSNH